MEPIVSVVDVSYNMAALTRRGSTLPWLTMFWGEGEYMRFRVATLHPTADFTVDIERPKLSALAKAIAGPTSDPHGAPYVTWERHPVQVRRYDEDYVYELRCGVRVDDLDHYCLRLEAWQRIEAPFAQANSSAFSTVEPDARVALARFIAAFA